MAWINLEVIGDGDKAEDIDSVEICSDENGNPLFFDEMEDADLWCQRNAEPGALYSHVEVRG